MAAVRKTNDDALQCKLSAVNAGYINDKFIKAFLKTAPQKEPMINRGTYTRTFEIDRIVGNYIQKYGGNCQIISIGAGSDTRWMNLKVRNTPTKGGQTGT
jgi:O-methyltransferase involved in polyketide biosynthesis